MGLKKRSPGTALGLALSALLALLPLRSEATDLALFDNALDGSPIHDRIRSARQSIDMELYEMTDMTVHAALIKAARAGVKVRILMEPRPVGKSCDIFQVGRKTPPRASDAPPNPEAIRECDQVKKFKKALEAAGGVMLPFNKALCGEGSGLPPRKVHPVATSACYQHGKLSIFDRQEALMSTGNLNPSSLCLPNSKSPVCNRDFTMAIRAPQIVKNLLTIFELDWQGEPYDVMKAIPANAFKTLTISPFSMDPTVDFISSARKSIEIEEQYLNDPTMNKALVNAARRGVEVRILVTSFCAFGEPEDPAKVKITRIYRAFEEAGAKIRTFPSAIKIREKTGYLHAKAIIVDGTTAWIGSVNGSTTSLTRNREYGIFFRDAKAISKLREIFDLDFANPNTQSWEESLRCVKDRFAPIPFDLFAA